jgi:3-methyladenine DNA glycosylase AlkC
MVQLKNFFNLNLIKKLSTDIKKVHKTFNSQEFEKTCLENLEELELKERALIVAKSFKKFLPDKYSEGLSILLNSIPSESYKDSDTGLDSMKSFYFMPHGMFVENYGLNDLEESVEAMIQITKRFTSEGTIRPFIEKYPKEMLKHLKEWTNHEDENVRRLVSEGTRPRYDFLGINKQIALVSKVARFH